MPNDAQRNPRLFNGLEIAGVTHRASGRETGSGWNTARLESNRLRAGTKSLRRFFVCIARRARELRPFDLIVFGGKGTQTGGSGIYCNYFMLRDGSQAAALPDLSFLVSTPSRLR